MYHVHLPVDPVIKALAPEIPAADHLTITKATIYLTIRIAAAHGPHLLVQVIAIEFHPTIEVQEQLAL